MSVPLEKRHKIIAAAYVIFRDGNKVLLLKRANSNYFDGYYSLPAGHFEGDETATQVAIREAKEEVGAQLSSQELRFVHVMHRKSDIPSLHERIDFFFETTKAHPEIANLEPHKCSELLWAEIHSLPENVVPEVRQALVKVSAHEPYSDYNFS